MQCNATKRAFNLRGVVYEEIDISKDMESLDKMLKMGYKSAPIVEYADTFWTGFQPDRIESIA